MRASRGKIFDQLDQFELSLRAELLDYEKMVEHHASLNDDLNDDPHRDPDEVPDANILAELSIQLDFAVRRPRTMNKRKITRRKRVSSGPPQSPVLNATKEIIDKDDDESLGESYGAEQNGAVATSDTTDAPQTPDQKGMIHRSPGEKSWRNPQGVESRKSQNSRTPSVSVEGRGRVLRRQPVHIESQSTREPIQATYKRSMVSLPDSLPFHLRN